MRNAPSRRGEKPQKPAAKTAEKTAAMVDQTIDIMGIVTWTDPMRPPEMFVLKAPFDPKAETAHLVFDLKLRSVASIEIRPARRPLKDTAGAIADGIRLANT